MRIGVTSAGIQRKREFLRCRFITERAFVPFVGVSSQCVGAYLNDLPGRSSCAIAHTVNVPAFCARRASIHL